MWSFWFLEHFQASAHPKSRLTSPLTLISKPKESTMSTS
ncbi:hypothetical protein I307_04291 [Cryptococcus deuterogattii 99/473]|uniref:Uncharacterized protein n=1 Tax=Cryptococcus deuterogattii Ram5 TaxID=1296110 RepID=A0A0D0V3P7_9TREE|nr:hypothetical protein I309_05331 [Cryptococcus deuterogattii LA55]KIR41219.1 hypothetical protein I313_02336 [Cryptococcus deuterogattii Ram5]KIR70037.1 hypothetical protein I310_06360 [Cryptococcus deuterogattii CA1014]KIR90040.1 hypothetical protein I304_06295 [Cryptococcus deuterogattii CBS 10090]KIR98767.1 hypothetical protein L804_04353 [Cryptococcus deuterogattii 2001/935-1]KIY56189.1 hypothetical protein I307_04291 [Cryptococcus deuterogattii 99/473]